MFGIFASVIVTNQHPFGDGLTQQQLSAPLGNRKPDLLIKMNPAVVTIETLQQDQKPIIEFIIQYKFLKLNCNTNDLNYNVDVIVNISYPIDMLGQTQSNYIAVIKSLYGSL